MKKLLVCMLLLAMAAALTACGSETAKGRTQAAGIETETEENTEQESDAAAVYSETGAKDIASDTEKTDTENETDKNEGNTMKITVGDITFTAALADNSSAEALKELLAEGPLTIDMSDYGNMEKVGPIGTSLPKNDEQITTGAGDIILYQGNSLVIYYDTNSWNFTRIGKIDGVTREELLDAFGEGNATVTFSLE